MFAEHQVTIIATGFGVFQAVVIAWLGYLQWRGAQRTKLIEDEEKEDQHLMSVFQSQLKSALARIETQDKLIAMLREEVNQLKIQLTDQIIENRKLRAEVQPEVT